MFSDESMLAFDSLNEFADFYEGLKIRNKWKIKLGDMNHRGTFIYDKPYTKQLRDLFAKKKLFRRNVSIAEIVSWLDSYVIIDRVINKLSDILSEAEYQEIKLYSEYRIRLSKNRRIDFIFEKGEKMLIAEFRLSDKFPNMTNIWQKKETELIIYKELLGNYLNNYQIYVYAFIAMPEFSGEQALDKNQTYNNNNVDHFARYIATYLFDKGELFNENLAR